MSSQDGGQRAFALLQVLEFWHADREIRKLYPIVPSKYHLELMSFASKYGMPSVAYRLADIQRVETGIKWYGALYPDLPFNKSIEVKDKALVMSIIRQESRFDQRGKSQAKAQANRLQASFLPADQDAWKGLPTLGEEAGVCTLCR